MPDKVLLQRAVEYATLSNITLDLAIPLGFGTDGSVWKSNRMTAVKALNNEKNYTIERECYQRFEKHRVVQIDGFAIPQLVGFNDDLWVVEMRIVTPPFLLDFAKAWLDSPADYSAQTMADWEQEGQERFEDRWPQVQLLLWSLRKYGIYYYDAKPANIMFAETGE